MNNLTSAELKLLDNLSKVHDPDVALGTKLQEIIAAIAAFLGASGTPVNAVAAGKTLTISDVVHHGETVSIGDDVYEFLTDAAQSKSAASNIAVDISSYAIKSSIALTVDTQPISGDTFTIGDKTYIFVPVGTANADGEISIGADLAAAQANIVAAINGTDGVNTAHPDVYAGDFADNACTITAFIGGVAGDLIGTTETFTAETNIFDGATLASGAECSAANAVTALVAAITASDTQGVGAAEGDGGTVVLTADVAGVSGNEIALATTMENGAFTEDAEALSGGIDGTVSAGIEFKVDESYLYVTPVANTISGANWRRIALGDVFY